MVSTEKKLFDGTTISRFGAVLVLLLVCSLTTQLCNAATQVSQFGITWTFNSDYQVGQFANGDYWVVGPVTIVDIDPPSSTSGRAMNGAMINPSPGSGITQGYDSETYAQYGPAYSSSLNVADGVSASNPLVVPNGSSLVSSISISVINRPQLKTAAILTVLSGAPPSGSFRPPYSGSDKSIKFNKSQLNYSILANLTPVGNTPSMGSIERKFERPWIEHVPDWLARYTHPSDNMPDYGRDMGTDIGEAALMLQINFTDAQKETLAIRFVQYGIDLYGVIQNGGDNNWTPNGGHAGGRKWPVVFAGLMLNNDAMANIGAGGVGNPHFGEDSQTFYVSQSDISSGRYLSSDLGLPEWGIRHATIPSMDDRSWSASYRACCTANSWAGIIIAARAMGAKNIWNHDSLFDYMDRFMGIQTPGDYYRQESKFAEAMWDTYRASLGPIWPNTGGGNQSPIANAGSDQDVSVPDGSTQTQVALDGTGSFDPDGTITDYSWIENSSTIASGSNPTVLLDVGVHTITLIVTDDEGATGSDTVVVMVQGPDLTGPVATSVKSSLETVELFFNETLDTASAENIANYAITEGVSIFSAQLNVSGNSVLLATSPHEEYVSYVLTASNVQDLYENAMDTTDIGYIYSNGLVAHWTFDEGDGPTAFDISGMGNDGILINGAIWADNTDVSLDGYDDAVEVPTVGWDANAGTVAIWATPQTLSGVQYLFGHTIGSWSNRIQIYTTDSSLNLGLGDSHTVRQNIATLQTDTYSHIALTWDNGTYAVYVDGNEKATGSYTGLSEINTLADLGNTGNVSLRNEAFDGRIHEAQVWNIPLTAIEIAELADMPEPEPGYVGIWKFNEESGTIAPDSSGLGNNATLINGPEWIGDGDIRLDGTDDAIEVPTNGWDVNAGTITMWIEPDMLTGKQYLFGHTVGTWSNRIQLYLVDGSLCLGLGDSHTTSLDIDTLTVGLRQHIALTWDSANYTVYVGGWQKASGTYTGLDTLNTYADIGNTGNVDFRNEVFSGLIDDVRVCSIVLTSDDIAQLASQGGYGIEMLTQLVNDWLIGDSAADIAPPGGDGIVDMLDFTAIAKGWLKSVED